MTIKKNFTKNQLNLLFISKTNVQIVEVKKTNHLAFVFAKVNFLILKDIYIYVIFKIM